MDIIEWANQNSGFLMAVLTAVYVVATVLIVIESRRSYGLTERLERDRNRPTVLFSLEFRKLTHSSYDASYYIFGVAKNTGGMSAHNVLINTDPPLQAKLGIESELRTPAIVDKSISVISQGQEITDLVGLSAEFFKDKTDDELVYGVTVTYSDIIGKCFTERYSIDLAPHKSRLSVEDSGAKLPYQLLEELRRTVRALEGIERAVGSSDRSQFMTPVDSSTLSHDQRKLLARLVIERDNVEAGQFFLQETMSGTYIQGIGDDKFRIDAQKLDVEYLCRAGALHGSYSRGLFLFAVTDVARRVVSAKDLTDILEGTSG